MRQPIEPASISGWRSHGGTTAPCAATSRAIAAAIRSSLVGANESRIAAAEAHVDSEACESVGGIDATRANPKRAK